eukprot:TRINITY_DN35429_c0_g1_i1.p1 TRINITY_DN35429_c0_g1~~TRINITY_DN35429_c0_g1_i1.p1  ORF type:complete len:507 (+),score=135.62 TRINITY_DN35429_c0_g1_i1:29-1522(+)
MGHDEGWAGHRLDGQGFGSGAPLGRIQPPAWIQDLQRSDYSPDALKALRRSEELAAAQGRACAPAHVAYVLVAEVLGTTGAPTPWGADVPGASAELLQLASSGSEASGEALQELLEAAASQRAPAKVGLRDLCAALFQQPLGLAEILGRRGLTAEGLRTALQASGQTLVPPPGSSASPLGLMQRQRPTGAESTRDNEGEDESGSILERFGKDLVEEAAQGRLDAVFGREEEVARVLRVLARRNKPNVCLLGPPGVGKTALVEEVARRIHLRQGLPRQLEGCRKVLQLSLGSLVGGTRYRGEFEKRIEKLLRELTAVRDEVILFIDEIHMALGAGETDKGSSMDAANLLKPALARGEIRCIGATTTAEYKKLIQNQDKAFERRFVVVELQEPSEASAEEMLLAARPAFEQHHGVVVTPEAVRAAVRSSGVLRGRFLPDRALDVLDDAATLASEEAEKLDEQPVCTAEHARKAAQHAASGASSFRERLLTRYHMARARL